MPPTSLIRILDATLNRASEGLRVVEDYARFESDDPFLTFEVKSLRHDLASAASAIEPSDRHAARDTVRDVGTRITTQAERNRSSSWEVCQANLKRAEQALRSLEEYGKLADTAFAEQMKSIRYRVYSLEKALDAGRSSRERMVNASLCVLVDGRESHPSFEQLVEALVSAGVGMIQLRDKRLDDRALLARAVALGSLTRRTATLAIVNDRADIAAAAGADGLHLGQQDLAVKDARSIVGTRMLLGVSTHNIDQARAAVLDGANYLGAGPTFPSTTKAFESLAGIDYLRRVGSEIRLPTFAIGGITASNLPEVLATGVSRVAVGAAVARAADPHAAATCLLSILRGESLSDR